MKISVLGWAVRSWNDRDGSLCGSLWVIVASLFVLAVALLEGCSGPSRANPVDSSLARESLKTALDHWKKGEDPKSLASSSTPIVARDFDWDSGAKLLDYQILGENAEDTNLRVQAKITLSQDGKKKSVEKKASYVVGTSPSVTVFRDVMRH